MVLRHGDGGGRNAECDGQSGDPASRGGADTFCQPLSQEHRQHRNGNADELHAPHDVLRIRSAPGAGTSALPDRRLPTTGNVGADGGRCEPWRPRSAVLTCRRGLASAPPRCAAWAGSPPRRGGRSDPGSRLARRSRRARGTPSTIIIAALQRAIEYTRPVGHQGDIDRSCPSPRGTSLKLGCCQSRLSPFGGDAVLPFLRLARRRLRSLRRA